MSIKHTQIYRKKPVFKPLSPASSTSTSSASATRFVWRLAPPQGAQKRLYTANSGRISAYNNLVTEAILGAFSPHWGDRHGGGAIIDYYDMAFSWHFEQFATDGVHYGFMPHGSWISRAVPPGTKRALKFYNIVDRFYYHTLLTSICAGKRVFAPGKKLIHLGPDVPDERGSDARDVREGSKKTPPRYTKTHRKAL